MNDIMNDKLIKNKLIKDKLIKDKYIKYDVIIVGAGAAGLFCGANADLSQCADWAGCWDSDSISNSKSEFNSEYNSNLESNWDSDSDRSQRLAANRNLDSAGCWDSDRSQPAAASGPAKKATGLILDGSKSCALKLLMSGGGQCNFTHGGDIKDYLDKYGNKGKKIRTALYKFNNQATINYFESKGLPTYTREDQKVFPKSMEAKDIKNLLTKEAKSNGFEIKEGEKVFSIEILKQVQESDETALSDSNDHSLSCCNLDTNNNQEHSNAELYIVNKRYIANKLVIATGGASYPTTGSDGSMFQILEDLGLTITPLKPALAPIFVQNYPFAELSGLGLTATLTLVPREAGLKPISVTDQFLLTHKGLSGPGIFILSRYANTGDKLVIDFLGDQVKKFDLNGVNKSILNYLIEETRETGLTKRFLELILENLAIDPQAKASSLPGKTAKVIFNHLKSMDFSISGTGGFNEAMATSGGVDLSEVSMKTMESKKHPGLHLIGEVLDVDGNTGGYNIQFAFSSGYIAAQHILL